MNNSDDMKWQEFVVIQLNDKFLNCYGPTKEEIEWGNLFDAFKMPSKVAQTRLAVVQKFFPEAKITCPNSF